MQLPITNVVNISVSAAQAGVGSYNTSNLALFTDEVPAVSFGTLGYAQYISPTQVAIDFGTDSKTYAMANAIFSQQPNILTGRGQLVIIPSIPEKQDLTLVGVPATGTFEVTYGGNNSAPINWNDTAAQIQTKIRAVAGLELVVVIGTLAGLLLHLSFQGILGNPAQVTITANSLQTSGSVAVTITPSTTTVGETLAAAITRTQSLVQYFGIIATANLAALGQTNLLAAAAVVQALNKIAFFVSNDTADISPAGMIDQLRSGGFTKSRGLYYGDATTLNTLLMMASYASRALSVDFSGSNTTITMHLKDLSGIQPDPTMTQTTLGLAMASGADVYVSLQGVSKIFTSGANSFYDQIYNEGWFVGALQVAGFNYLAQAATKIPQTEQGMTGLKGAYRAVCQQAIANQYGAPGSWTSATVFGVPADLISNISQVGYYIYSSPIATQLQADRAARIAPLIQIAFKEAGAEHSSSLIINVNA